MPLTPGTRLGTYEILERAGEGGMGVVYRARDERLDRDVALKLLAPAMVSDAEARRRLTHEARALSRLNHPNIATVYTLDADGDSDYIVMEWVPGTTLDERVTSGALDEPEVVRLALQATEALCAAHAAGVAHRDLKPANLKLTPGGRLKVLDFGLARRTQVDESGVTMTATEVGTTVGTLAYMPPEAFAGQPGDAAGDLWSLGVVLYELATGRRPFAGETAAQTMRAVVQEPIAPPRSANSAVSPGLQAIILKLMQRDREQRYGSAEALRLDLVKLRDGKAPGAEARARPSIAVLPLTNLSGDQGQDYFADGMTEALIGDLARVRELRVISRTSVMRYKGQQKPIPEIAAELGVEKILEGSVLRGGNRVRVSVQLIDAVSDEHLWADRYDRSMEDVLELQTDVAQAVVREIRAALLKQPAQPEGKTGLSSGATVHGGGALRRMDPQAYDAYLRGRHQLNRRSDESLTKAVDLFQSAIDLEPDYAPAHLGLGEARALLGFHEMGPPSETFARARGPARRALELDSDLGEAHSLLGYIETHYDWDWRKAESDFVRAVELGPNNAVIRLWYMNLLLLTSRFDEATEQARVSLELDPLSLVHNMVEGWLRFFQSDFENAFRLMERTLELEPGFYQAHQWRGWALALLGRRDAAVEHLLRAAESVHFEPTALHVRSLGHAFAGDPTRSREVLEDLKALRSKRYVAAFSIALNHVALDDVDEALEWLETAAEERSHWIGFINVDPRLEPLHGNPRFEALRKLPGSGTAPA